MGIDHAQRNRDGVLNQPRGRRKEAVYGGVRRVDALRSAVVSTSGLADRSCWDCSLWLVVAARSCCVSEEGKKGQFIADLLKPLTVVCAGCSADAPHDCVNLQDDPMCQSPANLPSN
jgi:hypothetical protein